MGNFQGAGSNRDRGGFRGPSSGGRPDFKRKSWGNDRGGDREPVTMHKAVCSECGKTCEVPFRPTGEKPVYCSDCFGGKRDGSTDRGPRKSSYEDRGPKRDFGDRSSTYRASPADDTKKQLADISKKLDQLVDAIEKMTQGRTTAPAKTEEAAKPTTLKSLLKKAVAPKATPKKVAKKAKK